MRCLYDQEFEITSLLNDLGWKGSGSSLNHLTRVSSVRIKIERAERFHDASVYEKSEQQSGPYFSSISSM